MEIYRIVTSKWANTLDQGSGRQARWNSKNVEMLYFAQSKSLAYLENIVHRDTSNLIGVQYCIVTVQCPDRLEEINILELPPLWNGIDENAYELCRPFGDNWISRNLTPILRVPSVLVPGEFNYLVNPKHSEISSLKIVDIQPFEFDSRIKI